MYLYDKIVIIKMVETHKILYNVLYLNHCLHISAKYKKSCDEYYQSGVNTSGVMLIDLDGAGDIDPVYVHCIMGYEKDYEFFGKTIVDHNFEENTTLRGYMMRDMRKLITYRY